MAVKASGRSSRNVVQLARPTLRETIARLAPGTALRDGLERILRGRTGALIVIGYDDSVEAHLRRRLRTRRPLRADPAARAVQDGRCGRAVQRRRPHRAGQRAAGARPVDPHRGIRHPAPFRRAHRHPDRLSGDLGEPLDEHRHGLRRGRAPRDPRFGGHPVAGQPDHRHARALQDPPRRGQQAALDRRDRGLRDAARRDDRGAATGDGAPDQPRDRLRRRRTGHRRTPAQAAAGGTRRRQRHRPRADRARLPRQPRPADGRLRSARRSRSSTRCRTTSFSTSPRWQGFSAIRRRPKRRTRR